jgi:hypothetical protein
MLTNLDWFQGEVLDVTIRRMARVEMADHVQMFELFTNIKEVAMVDKPEGAKKVDDCISLWTKMLLADATHDDTIAANVQSMQDAGIQHIGGIQEGLDRIYGLKKQTEEKRRHNLMSRIAKRMLNRVQSTALERWSENACELARQRAVLDRILKRMLNGKMSALMLLLLKCAPAQPQAACPMSARDLERSQVPARSRATKASQKIVLL